MLISWTPARAQDAYYYENGRRVAIEAAGVDELGRPLFVREHGAREGARSQPAHRQALTSRFAVQLRAGDDAQAIARQCGAVVVERMGYGDGLYVFEADCAQTALATANRLHESGAVAAAEPLFAREMFLRYVPDDPMFGSQWGLFNAGQGGGDPGNDVNATEAWEFTLGAGTVISIVDEGVQRTHPDLSANYSAALSWDFNDNDPDPTPSCSRAHGTACAGIAGARGNNAIGVSGAAPLVTLAGSRLLAASFTEQQEADALSFQMQAIDIYNNSWGPSDGGFTLAGPGLLSSAAIRDGVTLGRGGLGCIYVWAGGNGRAAGDNANKDGYANSRYTIAVASTTNLGTFGSYSEEGACILVNTPSSGGTLAVTTTDNTGGCGYSAGDYTTSFGMTSASAPLAAGCIALMLSANPALTWRDVQHILVHTSAMNDPGSAGWALNGAGLPVHHSYGFGRIDAHAAVQAAVGWTTVGPEVSTSVSAAPALAVPDNDPGGVTLELTITDEIVMEAVEIPVSITTLDRGDLRIQLISPSGTVSALAAPSNDSNDHWNWTFTTMRCWDENSAGVWTLRIADETPVNIATINSWGLKAYGTHACPGIPGNFNLDCDVDLDDFATFAVCFGGALVTTPPAGCSSANFALADFNGDGYVDLNDFATFAQNFGG